MKGSQVVEEGGDTGAIYIIDAYLMTDTKYRGN